MDALLSRNSHTCRRLCRGCLLPSLSYRLLIVFLLVVVPSFVTGLAETTRRRADVVQDLRRHLFEANESSSRIHSRVQVISLGESECGMVFGGPVASEDEMKGNKRQQNSEIVFVDRKHFWKPQMGLETLVGQALSTYLSLCSLHHENLTPMLHTDKLPHIYLALYVLLYKKGQLPTSPLQDFYMATLPTRDDLEHLPIFWQAAIPPATRVSSNGVEEQGQTRKEEWTNEFRVIRQAVSSLLQQQTSENTGMHASRSFEIFELDDWFWARSIVTSRAFTDSQDGLSHGVPILCPFVDMLNHFVLEPDEAPREAFLITPCVCCSWKITKDGYHLSLPTSMQSSSLDATTALEISYGNHSSEYFLLNYGFSIGPA